MAVDEVEIEAGDRSVRISSPGRVYFPARGETKLDLVRYYLSVGDGIVRAGGGEVGGGQRADKSGPMSGVSSWIRGPAAGSPPCAGSPMSCTRSSASSA